MLTLINSKWQRFIIFVFSAFFKSYLPHYSLFIMIMREFQCTYPTIISGLYRTTTKEPLKDASAQG